MEIDQICPCCGDVHKNNIKFEWNREEGKPNGRMHLQLRLTSQSVKVDGGRIETLHPYADDGSELTIKANWVKDGVLDLDICRMPRVAAPAPATPALNLRITPDTATLDKIAADQKTMADLQTEAAELGMTVDKKMNRAQLAVALNKHKESQK